MGHMIQSIAAALSVAVVTPAPAFAQELIVGISPYAASSEEARVNTVRTLQFLTQELQPGESAQIIDAANVSTICAFSVPDRGAYRHEKAKLAFNAPCVGKLLKRAESAAQSAPVPYAVQLPDFLRFVGQYYPASEEVDVLIFGSPLFDDPRGPSVSMARGHVPGDGHLNAPLHASPYSAAQAELLSKMRVHFVALDPSWAINREHEYFVQRLWSLFIEAQGGSLVTFTTDPQTAYARIRDHAAASVQDFQLASTTKLEMVPIRRDTGARTPIHQRPVSETPLAAPERRAASNVEIGITWDCARCDLDLYARPWRGAEVLYFNRTNSPEGQFFKDFRHSPDINNGLESIEFVVPIDLEKLLIAVNLYEGAPPKGSITGEIRIAVGERTYAAPFSLQASSGNRGAGASDLFAAADPSSGPGWVVIDTASVLGLRR